MEMVVLRFTYFELFAGSGIGGMALDNVGGKLTV